MKQDVKLKLGFPSQGWKQFHTARKEMLSAFDAAKEKGEKHKVEVYHGFAKTLCRNLRLHSFARTR